MNANDLAESRSAVSVKSGSFLAIGAIRLKLHIMFKLVLGCGDVHISSNESDSPLYHNMLLPEVKLCLSSRQRD